MNKTIYRIFIFTVMFFTLLVSCTVKTRYLNNNRTRVPLDNSVFSHRPPYNFVLSSMIDTTAIYEEYSIDQDISERLNNQSLDRKKYSVLKFYANGCFNLFSFNKGEKYPGLIEMDPEFSGLRGIYYYNNGQVFMELYTSVDEFQNMGSSKSILRISGDTLFQRLERSRNKKPANLYTMVYVKRRLPEEYFKYRASW